MAYLHIGRSPSPLLPNYKVVYRAKLANADRGGKGVGGGGGVLAAALHSSEGYMCAKIAPLKTIYIYIY